MAKHFKKRYYPEFDDTYMIDLGFRIRKFKVYLTKYTAAYINELLKHYSIAFDILRKHINHESLTKGQIRKLRSAIRRHDNLDEFNMPNFPNDMFYEHVSKLPRNVRDSLVFETIEAKNVDDTYGLVKRKNNFVTFLFEGTVPSKVKFPINNSYISRMFKKEPELHINPKLLDFVDETVLGIHATPKHLRIVKEGNQFFAEVIFKVSREVYHDKKLIYPENHFLGIDLNVKYIAIIDDVKKIPMLLSLKHTINAGYNIIRKNNDLRKVREKVIDLYKRTFKLYVSKIVKHCYYNRINYIAIGKVKTEFTEDKERQLWDFIPWDYFFLLLKSSAEVHGIKVIQVDESFTSQASALHDDPLTKWEVNKYGPNFSGKRVNRGLYLTKEGIAIHSDVNSAANILKKLARRFKINVHFNKNQLSAVRSLGYHILSKTKTLCQAMILKKLKDFPKDKMIHLDQDGVLGELEVCRHSPGPWLTNSNPNSEMVAVQKDYKTGESKIVYYKNEDEPHKWLLKPSFLEVTNGVIKKLVKRLRLGLGVLTSEKEDKHPISERRFGYLYHMALAQITPVS